MGDDAGSCRWFEHAWEQPLQKILQSIEGPVAMIVAVIIIVVTGLTLAFGDTSAGFRLKMFDPTGRSSVPSSPVLILDPCSSLRSFID